MNELDAQPFRILSLAGGGYLGLYTAGVLAGLEAAAGEPLARRFNLIAGTSVGGLLGLALAFEIPVERVVSLFRKHGSEIFSARRLPTSGVGRLWDLTRSVLGPKYTGAALRAALEQLLQGRRLVDAMHALLVPAVNVSLSQTKVFKTPHGRLSQGDERVLALDVAMATAAAPGYFPSVKVGRYLYADGGMFAVAPDQIAMHEAESFLNVPAERVQMLSIGTATAGYRPADGVDAADGAVGWLSDGRLILTTVSVQQQHVQAMMEDRLGARFQRIDADWPRGAGLGIDVATPAAAATLLRLAERTLARMSATDWQRALGASR